ncbi:hypothetical protein ACFLZ2_05005 [Candidatus Margulisiibacteriota bacterium]
MFNGKKMFLILVPLMVLLSVSVFAAAPYTMNFQGRVIKNDGTPETGVKSIKFELFDVSSGGVNIWTETLDVACDTDGVFNVILGNGTPLDPGDFNQQLWMQLSYDPGGGLIELLPRQKLTPAPYAINAVPSGVIVMWSGLIASIPSGWALCDGTNGTPNLRDRFIVGAGTSYAVNTQGGSNTHTLSVAEMPSHTHNYSMPTTAGGFLVGSTVIFWQAAAQVTTPTGENQPHENRPPYYALAYIMKL